MSRTRGSSSTSSRACSARRGASYENPVPSSGSTIQVRSFAEVERLPSSPTRPSSGRSLASSSRIARSASRSASETGSVTDVFEARPSSTRLQEVDGRVDEDPHHVDEVPVDARHLDAAVLLRGEVAAEGADRREDEE